MSALLESQPKTAAAERPSTFHIRMAYACGSFLALSWIGCYLTSVPITGVASSAIAISCSCVMVCPLSVYWHEKGRRDMRDAAMTIPWFVVLLVILPIPVAACARMGFPLQDSRLAQIDNFFGVRIPEVTSWASGSQLGRLANRCYPLLIHSLPIAFILLALTGRVKHAQRFLLSNLVAYTLGLPLFSLVPAIGPWYAFGTTPSPDQALCQSSLLHLRHAESAGIYGVICFPSFHVIWAILCAAALWTYKPLRVPIALLYSLIILSTITTGWHYFTDVVAGAAVALLSLKLSFLLTKDSTLPEVTQ